MSFLNSWFIRYLVIFSFIGAILYGFYHYIYPTPYYLTDYSSDTYHYILKVNRKTGEVYRFSTSTTNGRTWELLNK